MPICSSSRWKMKIVGKFRMANIRGQTDSWWTFTDSGLMRKGFLVTARFISILYCETRFLSIGELEVWLKFPSLLRRSEWFILLFLQVGNLGVGGFNRKCQRNVSSHSAVTHAWEFGSRGSAGLFRVYVFLHIVTVLRNTFDWILYFYGICRCIILPYRIACFLIT